MFQKELVVSAHYSDGKNFPQKAKDRQSMTFEEYTSTSPVFWKTLRADEFEDKCLKKFTEDVAVILNAAPPYSADFPLDEATGELVLPEIIPIERPGNG